MKKQVKKEVKSSKFLNGALIGAALGVATGLFATSKKGKEITKEVKNKSVEFYKYIAPQIKKVKDVGEKEYKAFISRALVDYKKKKNKKLTEEDLKNLEKEAKASWKHIKKNF